MPKQYCRLKTPPTTKRSSKTYRLLSQRTFCIGERYETEISHTGRYCNDVGLLPLVRKRPDANIPIGVVVPVSAATRTISIDAKTKYVNVTAHETVRFLANGSAFAITFNGSSATTFAFAPSVFDLNQLAPAGVLNHKVTVYVAPDPLYISG